ncbi:hypothetical protein K7432_013830 [Basidiobolus ranarum]|uniref:Uncharacterized protein n=1 Tax=Basidiobolus ranarum TaxID=34480 RepID=A0ABR2WIK1_9FUNG
MSTMDSLDKSNKTGLLSNTSTAISSAAAAITSGVGLWLYGNNNIIENEMARLYPTVPSNIPIGKSIIPELANVDLSSAYPIVRSDILMTDQSTQYFVDKPDNATVAATTLETDEMPIPGAYVDKNEEKQSGLENQKLPLHSEGDEKTYFAGQSDPPHMFKTALGTAGVVGAVAGAGYAYYKYRKESGQDTTKAEEKFWILHRQKSLEDIVEHRPPPANDPDQITKDEANFWIEHRRKSLDDILQNKPLPATKEVKKVATGSNLAQENVPLTLDSSLYYVPLKESNINQTSVLGPRQRAIYQELNSKVETESTPIVYSNNEPQAHHQSTVQSTTKVPPMPQLAEDYIRNTQPTGPNTYKIPTLSKNNEEVSILTQHSGTTTEVVSAGKGKNPEHNYPETDSETNITDPMQTDIQKVPKKGTFKRITRTVRKRLNSLLGGRNQAEAAH